MKTERARLSKHAPVAKAMDYMLIRWDGFVGFLTDGRACLTNNAAERSLRGVALGRKSWLFAGSERGGDRAAFMYTLIVTARLNDVDPQAWLANVIARIADTPDVAASTVSSLGIGPPIRKPPKSRPPERGPRRMGTFDVDDRDQYRSGQ